jgi:hypothetical protein
MPTDTGGYAHPRIIPDVAGCTGVATVNSGMTLLDHFAEELGKSLLTSALHNAHNQSSTEFDESLRDVPKNAYMLAKRFIAEKRRLEKETT